jgi:hypothetical protein
MNLLNEEAKDTVPADHPSPLRDSHRQAMGDSNALATPESTKPSFTKRLASRMRSWGIIYLPFVCKL